MFLQFLNATPVMVFIEFPTRIVCSELQREKALSPIVSTPSGITRFFIAEQPVNASPPMHLMDAEIFISVIKSQLKKLNSCIL